MDTKMSHFFCHICWSVCTAYFYSYEKKSQQMVIFCSCLEVFMCLPLYIHVGSLLNW